MLPEEHAFDFLRFCLQNPKFCPLLGVTNPGQTSLGALAAESDIRTDIPLYRVYREGEHDTDLQSIEDVWQNDLVTFLLGCSFSWEDVLDEHGLRPRQIEENCNVPMYVLRPFAIEDTWYLALIVGLLLVRRRWIRARFSVQAIAESWYRCCSMFRCRFRTNIESNNVGAFGSTLVVSMRPYRPDQLSRVFDITNRYPGAHGAPLHWGDPEEIGIDSSSIHLPQWGDPVTVKDDEVPVFWACCVSSQVSAVVVDRHVVCHGNKRKEFPTSTAWSVLLCPRLL